MRLQGGEAPSDPRLHDSNAVFQVLPEPLDGVQLRAIRGQPHEDDVLRYRHALGHVCRGLVQQDAVETLRIALAKLVKKDAAALGVQAWQLPPERLPGGGFDRRIEPVRLLQRRNNLARLHAVACQPTVEGPVQAQTRFILAEDPHGLVGRLPPSGGASAEATRALLNKIRRLGDVFFAWLGRGRFSFALR